MIILSFPDSFPFALFYPRIIGKNDPRIGQGKYQPRLQAFSDGFHCLNYGVRARFAICDSLIRRRKKCDKEE
jgi:hypothetical protein